MSSNSPESLANPAIPEDAPVGPNGKHHVHNIDLGRIQTRTQVRTQFEKLDELAESIRVRGIEQLIIIRREQKANGYLLIAGERRFSAAKLAGLLTVPCIVKPESTTDTECLELQIIENIQREDLNPLEEAKAFKAYMDQTGCNARQFARKIGKNETTVTRALRYLKMPEHVKTIIANGEIKKSLARELARFDDEETMREYLALASRGEITAAEVAAIASKRTPKSKKPKPTKPNPGLSFLTESGVEIIVRMPAKHSDTRWTYDHVAEALGEATEEVQHRIKNRVQLSSR